MRKIPKGVRESAEMTFPGWGIGLLGGALVLVCIFAILMVNFKPGDPAAKEFSIPENNSTPRPEGKEWKITLPKGVEMEFCFIPKGSFKFGNKKMLSDFGFLIENLNDSSFEKNIMGTKISLSKPFYMGKYEVTQEQWEAVMGNNPSCFKGNPKKPVESVSWEDCQRFIRKMNNLGKGKFHLPTEVEWEYAYRAGTTKEFYWGDMSNLGEIDNYAWYGGSVRIGGGWTIPSGNGGKETHEVGQKKPNPWGLYDMAGNVWELCEYLDGKPSMVGTRKTQWFRGGAWNDSDISCQATHRWSLYAGGRLYDIGLRLVLEAW